MSDPALLVRARRLRAARGVVVARDVTLAAAPGDVVAVEGPNGSGKSTLLAAAAGLLPADKASVRPGSVGYSPERAGTLPRVPLRRWLLGLARTAGLDRDESARRAGDLLGRLGLAHASAVSLHALSRGNAQRALVAQALLADPDLLILDEPAGGMDADGVSRVAAEIQRAASRRAVVLVARHPTAPLPLPAGLTWRLHQGVVDTRPREGDTRPREGDARLGEGGARLGEDTMEVETGDGTVQRVGEAGLPAVLRAALDAGQAIRRVQPVPGASAGPSGDTPSPAAHPAAARPAPRRAGAGGRVLHGAVHRARLLTSSQWFLAPAMLFLVVLGIVYATDAGPPLQAAAVTAITLAPLMTWLGVLAHRVDGRELARAFAAHVGGRARAHLAADLGLAPFAVLLSLAALVAPLISQGEHPHPALLDGKIVLLHLAAAVLGAGIGSLLALIERAGWRLLAAVAVYIVLFVVRGTPMAPLLRLSTHPATLETPAGGPALWLFLPGAALMAAAALLASRLT
ncbi:MAG TPA: ATP-binding cassette domain-containing protein [Streptosporangiaceae bacterium]|nr:ATP-binding cassette domain-containing protein [Streptosporangiaceae bacterium]